MQTTKHMLLKGAGEAPHRLKGFPGPPGAGQTPKIGPFRVREGWGGFIGFRKHVMAKAGT